MTNEFPRETSLVTRLMHRLTNTEPTVSDTTPRLAQSEVYSLLSADRRRYILEYLATTDDPVPVGRLTDKVAAVENDCPPRDVTDTQRKRVSVSLVQSHLPRLAEVGVIDYDDEYGTVSTGPQFEHLWRVHTTVQETFDE